MSQLRIRAITREDAPAVTELMAAAESVDRTGEHYSLDDVLEDLANPMVDPQQDWLVVEVGDVLVAHSRLQPRAPAHGSLSVGLDGTVHPTHRRQGVGSALLPAMVRRAEAYVTEKGPDLVPVVTIDALSTDTALGAIAGREGLEPARWEFGMAADLSRPGSPAPALPPGYTLQTWEGLDEREIREVHNRAFVGHYGFSPWSEQMWTQWVSGSRSFRPTLSLLARDEEGSVAAYVQTAEFEAHAEATGVREAYVAKVGTVPEHRRRGLAETLLAQCLELYREAGFGRAALDVDSENPTGALGLYRRAGFEVEVRWTSYRREGHPT